MIIENGTIEIKAKTGGGIDPTTGYPIKPSSVEWVSPIPCQYSPNTHNNLGMINGEHYTVATYEILIEQQPFNAEQIRLKDNAGKVVGEFSVISAVLLEAVCEIRILV